eukprot:13224013-Alexandrium_andersonii.AAC.1
MPNLPTRGAGGRAGGASRGVAVASPGASRRVDARLPSAAARLVAPGRARSWPLSAAGVRTWRSSHHELLPPAPPSLAAPQ